MTIYVLWSSWGWPNQSLWGVPFCCFVSPFGFQNIQNISLESIKFHPVWLLPYLSFLFSHYHSLFDCLGSLLSQQPSDWLWLQGCWMKASSPVSIWISAHTSSFHPLHILGFYPFLKLCAYFPLSLPLATIPSRLLVKSTSTSARLSLAEER